MVRSTKLARPIPDGFGGWRDTPAPVFTGVMPEVRFAAFDRETDKSNEQLLMLLKFAAEHPCRIEFATDRRLMATTDAPAVMQSLLHGWRHDHRAAGLVTATVRSSRKAGRPVWPEEIASEMRDFASRAGASAAEPRRDWSSGPSR